MISADAAPELYEALTALVQDASDSREEDSGYRLVSVASVEKARRVLAKVQRSPEETAEIYESIDKAFRELMLPKTDLALLRIGLNLLSERTAQALLYFRSNSYEERIALGVEHAIEIFERRKVQITELQAKLQTLSKK